MTLPNSARSCRIFSPNSSRVPVRGCPCDCLRADDASRAGTVVHDDLDSGVFGKTIRHDPRHDVGAAAGRHRNHQSDGPCSGITGRLRRHCEWRGGKRHHPGRDAYSPPGRGASEQGQ